jgi:aerobic carbon-monoxide dehydrogenase medium subunit
MLPKFELIRPATLIEATSLLASQPDDAGEAREMRLLTGGQSLIAAMKLGLAAPTELIDLQAIPELRQIELLNGDLHIGAMATHAGIAASSIVREFCPMLPDLAAGIADQQVRNRGTIGGSLANNDPAADWPCGLLAVAAVIHGKS